MADGRNTNVILVDDDEDQLSILSLLLTIAGFSVHPFRTSAAVAAEVASIRPRAVITDLCLPRPDDGLQLVRSLHATVDRSRTAVVVLSGWDEPELRRQALSAGCDRFFQKPVEPDALIAYLQSLHDLPAAV